MITAQSMINFILHVSIPATRISNHMRSKHITLRLEPYMLQLPSIMGYDYSEKEKHVLLRECKRSTIGGGPLRQGNQAVKKYEPGSGVKPLLAQEKGQTDLLVSMVVRGLAGRMTRKSSIRIFEDSENVRLFKPHRSGLLSKVGSNQTWSERVSPKTEQILLDMPLKRRMMASKFGQGQIYEHGGNERTR